MKILVSGATGFLGSRVVERLAAGGSHVRCLVRRTSDTLRLQEIRDRYPSASIELIVGNLIHCQDVRRALRNIDVVCHLAAEMRDAPANLFLNNVVGFRNLLDAAQKSAPSRVILVSSVGVYGVAGVTANRPVDEDWPLEPFPERRDVYTHTKVLQELLFQRYRSGGCFQSVILRPGVIYGESRDPLFSRTGIRIGGLVFQPGARGTLPISYVENCASAVVWATTFKVPEGAYNVIDDEAPTAGNFLRQYEEQVGGIFAVRLPKLLVYATSYCVEKYSRYSCGQIPPFLTPYKLNSTWTAHRFENARLKSTGWVQPVPTSEAIRRTFRHAAGIRSIQTAAERNSYASSWHI